MSKLEQIICNLCWSADHDEISSRDRYGFKVRTVICRHCGLIFINPRMSAADYDNFYQSMYRTLVEKYHKDLGEEDSQNLDAVFESGRKRGELLVNFFGERLSPGLTLEVGSSCGGVLAGFREKLKERHDKRFDILGIEPSKEEAAYAVKKNIPTHVALFENFSGDLPKVQNIIIVRSLNHILDPKRFFEWSYRILPLGGHLVVAVLNFHAFCGNKGKIETQIDHPFMFSENTLKNFALSSGFQINLTCTKGSYLYLLAEKTGAAGSQSYVSDYENAMKSLNPVRLIMGYYFRKFKTFIRHSIGR